MHFNKLFKFTSLLGLAGLVQCGSYRMSFYGESVGDRPSVTAIPACGIDGVDLNTEYFLALNHIEYNASLANPLNPNTAKVCNKCVKIMYKNKWAVGKIVDKCPGCPNKGIDASPTLFEIFADRDTGIIYMDWEYTDCSLLGKTGTCSGTCTSSNSNSGEVKKTTTTTVKRTTTTTVKKITTTTTRKTVVKTTTTTAYVRPTTSIVVKSKTTTVVVPTSAIVASKNTIAATTINRKIVTTVKTLPTGVNLPTLNNALTTGIAKVNTVTAAATRTQNNVPIVTPIVQASNTNTNTNTNTNNVSGTQPTVLNSTSEKKDEGSNSTYVLPITGALVISGAAGIGLIYAKRDSNNLNNLKEKFPEAFSNIKRSISRSSTQLRRGLSQSGKALKRSLSKKNDATGPNIRTKKEYRESLDAHYPLQPVQLYDPPVSNSNGYNNVPTTSSEEIYSANDYHLQQFNSHDEPGDLQIDFHDNHY